VICYKLFLFVICRRVFVLFVMMF